ncbi:hypothetical protein PVAP13_7KG281300, partial [Panicum virgatum]
DKTICNMEIKFEDLPEDIQCTILSKLPLKELVRTSILSSEWRYLWVSGRNGCMTKFINNVNTVLHRCHGEVVEELKVKFGFHSTLAHHTKVLAFDLEPIDSCARDDHYIFPFQLLNNESISCLQSIQLSFVSLKPPFQFGGFPNLRKLDLSMVHVTGKDLEDTLSSCCNIEWIPLFHLLHLHIVRCDFTKIELHAVNLHTFAYRGPLRPIVLNHSSKLNDVIISLYEATFQHHAFASLLNGLPSVKHLTFHIIFLQIEMQGLSNNPYKFSRLRNLQLFMNIVREDADKILCLVSFLRATPLIEILEVHFGCADLWFADVLTVYTTRDMHEHAGQVSKCCLSQKRSPTLKFYVV